LEVLQLPCPPKEVSLLDPYLFRLHLANGDIKEIPWDYARHFADKGYREQTEQSAAHGRRLLSKRLQWLRREAGLSQEELAERAGISRVTIARIEAGEQSPRYETLVRLAKSLQIPLERLLID